VKKAVNLIAVLQSFEQYLQRHARNKN